MKIKACTFILLLLSVLFTYAKKDYDAETIQEEYKDYIAVILTKEVTYTFDITDNLLDIKKYVKTKKLILNEHSKALTNDYIYFSSMNKVDGIEAYTLVKERNKTRKIPVTQFKQTDDQDHSIFFDDSKVIQFSYPSLEKFATTNLEYRVNFKNPRYISRSFFDSFLPVLHSRVVLKIHKDITVGFKLLNTEKLNCEQKQYTKGKYNYYEFELKKLDEFKHLASRNYTLSYYSPHILIYLTETNIGDKQVKYYGALKDLHQYYVSLMEKKEENNSKEFIETVKKITQNCSTNKEKAKAIYYWVQENIKYVAYEEGMKGFIPFPANEVFVKRYGDCKGMTNLIVEMMKIAGIKAYHAWVGTRSIPYEYEATPLPETSNHMVAIYCDNDSTYVLDGTFKYLDFGVTPYHIQNKDIFYFIDDQNYKVYRPKIAPANYSTLYDSVHLTIDNLSIKGKGKRINKGYTKNEMAYALDEVKKEDMNKRLSTILEKGNNKFYVTDHQLKNIFEHNKNAEIDYDFTIDDYCNIINEEIYINLNLDKSYQELFIDTTKKWAPIENDFYCDEILVCTLDIPDGYSIDYLPKNYEFQNEFFSASIKYYDNDQMIKMWFKIEFKFFFTLEAQVKEWNQMIKELKRQFRASIVLKKNKK